MSHHKILREGVTRWNVWRIKHPETRPSLAGADLRREMLRGVNLRGADLAGVNLRDANLRYADLSHSNLSGAILNRAFFSAANLRSADLKRARLYETVFANADLSGAKGLDECDHRGPSVIDHRTLARSGKLPLVFLRGCGLPELLISEPAQPPDQYYSCFISYSTADREFVERLFEDLQDAGVRCWYAPEDIKIGHKIRDAIDAGIQSREKLLLILSSSSISSAWVEKEVETAMDQERTRGEPILFPVRVDDAAMSAAQGWAADIRRTRHIGDFRQWRDGELYAVSLSRLLRDLSVLEHRAPNSGF